MHGRDIRSGGGHDGPQRHRVHPALGEQALGGQHQPLIRRHRQFVRGYPEFGLARSIGHPPHCNQVRTSISDYLYQVI
ncbi:hypothetical protein NWFMUON74_50770 [Nocardia wallacei]|uniref:Uncharacterized protein n=1 Tax=Nocardia wallacei TaxID=480035 RepID=A0A7G1KPX2_9NOCA|nr:hypothetical protein NWFMUON74_50770 [Nocardia wallacei]